MIHFSCDGCGGAIDPAVETRYVVRMEVYAAVEDTADPALEDADHLEEIEDILERLDEEDDDAEASIYRQVRYDLCEACRERFVSNPLGRGMQRLDYSDN